MMSWVIEGGGLLAHVSKFKQPDNSNKLSKVLAYKYIAFLMFLSSAEECSPVLTIVLYPIKY